MQTRRRILELGGLGAAGLAFPGSLRSALAADSFVWAGVGGRWAEMVVESFIKGSKSKVAVG